MAFDDIESYWQNITTLSTSSIEWLQSTTASTQEYTNLTNFVDAMDTTSTINNDTSEVPYEDYKYRPETYMVPIMFGIIFIVGVVGNGTLIIVFIRHRAMRNVPNT